MSLPETQEALKTFPTLVAHLKAALEKNHMPEQEATKLPVNAVGTSNCAEDKWAQFRYFNHLSPNIWFIYK
jgi:hypothetical protein